MRITLAMILVRRSVMATDHTIQHIPCWNIYIHITLRDSEQFKRRSHRPKPYIRLLCLAVYS
jgi:hypothetical protein